ncbi:MAG: Tim44/TimA family putative adaptor protein [Kiloniellales bacterium]
MGNGIQFLDIILFAAIAAFLVLRLRGVLGRRTGHDEQSKFDPFRSKQRQQDEESGEDKVISLPDRAGEKGAEDVGEAGSPLEHGLTQIQLVDRAFDAEGFASGAKIAFEIVVAAFAEGDTKTLRPLLSNDVYEDFAGAIKGREEGHTTLETTLVGIGQADIIEAELQGKTAFVTIKFVSEQINVTRNAEGEAVDGDPSHVTSVTDIWTFARNTRSRDPNWTLVATGSSN